MRQVLPFHIEPDSFFGANLGRLPYVEQIVIDSGAVEVHNTTSLTPLELGIMTLGAVGLSEKQSGAKIYRSTDTIHSHRQHSFRKLGVSRMEEAVEELFALETFGVQIPLPACEISVRETEVLEKVAQGLTDAAIGQNLDNISPHTVHTHITSLFDKLGANNRARLVLMGHLTEILPSKPLITNTFAA